MKSMNPYITDVCVLVGQFTALKLKNAFPVRCIVQKTCCFWLHFSSLQVLTMDCY